MAEQSEAKGASGGGEWASAVFGCFSDITGCLCGLCCLPCLTCKVSKGLSEQMSICNGCCCFPESVIGLRAMARTKWDIQGSICNDVLCWTCCLPCVVCQMDRELKARGLEADRFI